MACLDAYQKSNSESIGSYDAYRALSDLSSVDLLRTSIFRSIRKRAYENQGFLERTLTGSESNSVQYSRSKYTVVEVENIDQKSLDDAESDLSDSERRDFLETYERSTKEKESTVANASGTEELSNSISTNFSEVSQQSSNSHQTSDDWCVIRDKKQYPKESTDSEMNNFILARRKFSNSIYQDCSTYDITCPTVDLKEVDDKSSQSSYNHTETENLPFSMDNISLASKDDYSFSLNSSVNIDKLSGAPNIEKPNYSVNINKPNSSTNNDKHVDDHHSTLYDTFFTQMDSAEVQTAHDSYPLHEFRRTDSPSSLVEKEINTNEQEQQSTLPAKRKFSKRHRKRSRKKNKSKKSYVYECTKCGVNYFIPTKAMNNVACCLHCDLWTPVEPVFVRREKTSWNTCCIS